MKDDPTLRLVAHAAHECWCERMRARGWHAAAAYSEPDKAHDALQPFDSLSLPDQRRTLRALRCEDIGTFLADLLDYPRGEPGVPELQIEDMVIGRAVRRIADDGAGAAGLASRGHIVSWSINPDTGELDLVRVRWDDGSESEHTPPERELTLDGPAEACHARFSAPRSSAPHGS
ncbi:MAG: hypothetical protein KF869_06470 [Phycisphaeraceae bacterium]|nr:hypothetical protein [Phycisphaeraceae bacterium]